MSANIAKIAKVTRCMPVELFEIKIDTIGHYCVPRSKNTPYKYCKNRKNNKLNKIHDFGKEEAKRDPEMSAKIAKVTRIFHAS